MIDVARQLVGYPVVHSIMAEGDSHLEKRILRNAVVRTDAAFISTGRNLKAPKTAAAVAESALTHITLTLSIVSWNDRNSQIRMTICPR